MTRIHQFDTFRHAVKARGITFYHIAKELRIERTRVSAFFGGHLSKISKHDRKLIRRWLIEQGIIVVKSRPKHQCPHCDSVHAIRTQSKPSQKNAQSETVEKKF